MMNRELGGPRLHRLSKDRQPQGAPALQAPCARSADFPGRRSFPARRSLSAGRSTGGSRLMLPETPGVPAPQAPSAPGGPGPALPRRRPGSSSATTVRRRTRRPKTLGKMGLRTENPAKSRKIPEKNKKTPAQRHKAPNRKNPCSHFNQFQPILTKYSLSPPARVTPPPFAPGIPIPILILIQIPYARARPACRPPSNHQPPFPHAPYAPHARRSTLHAPCGLWTADSGPWTVDRGRRTLRSSRCTRSTRSTLPAVAGAPPRRRHAGDYKAGVGL
jgi:hypothetical protein